MPRLPGPCSAALLALLLLAPGCTSGSTSSSIPSTPPGAASPSGPPRLSLGPAPFQLPVPLQREVAVAHEGRVFLAGGLDPGGRSVNGVFSLDPETGRVAQLGSMPQPFHDAAGAVLG